MAESVMRHDETLMAEIAVLALCSIAPNASRRHPYFALLPSPEPLEPRQLIDRLAGLPKPVSCFACNAFGVLAVGCWPVSDGDDQESIRDQIAAEKQEAKGRLYRLGDANSKVIVRGRDVGANEQERAVSLGFIEAFLQSYVLLNADYSFLDADAAARSEGAVAVLVFGSQEGTTITISRHAN